MAGIRAGFFVGFLGGALLSSQQGQDEPSDAFGAAGGEPEPRGPLQKLKARLREALAAGREAAQEKERELREEFERRTRPRP